MLSSNPFFILGVYVNAPTKDILANKSRISAYSKVEKKAEFSIDSVLSVLGASDFDRSDASVSMAINQVSLPNDKLASALFGLADATQFDNMAMQYIQAGNIDKAKEILSKKENWSSLLNLATISASAGDRKTQIANILKLIHTNSYRQDFCHSVCGDNFSIPTNDLRDLFFDQLKNDESVLSSFPKEDYPDDYAEISSAIIGKYTSVISREIANAKAVDAKDSEASYTAGESLIKNTEEALKKLKVLADSSTYQISADSLAKQILQCGINYYNTSERGDAAKKALVIQKKAEEIAVGKLTKDRCVENTKILQKNIENMPPEAVVHEFDSVHNVLAKHKAETCSEALSILKECAPFLVSIKEKVGQDEPKYRNLSDLVANVALSKVISQINALIEQINNPYGKGSPMNQYGYLFGNSSVAANARASLKSCIGTAWVVIRSIESLDTTSDFITKRLKPNKQTLGKLRQDLNSYSQDESAIDMRTAAQKEADAKARKRGRIIGWSLIAGIVGLIWWATATEDDRSWGEANSSYRVSQYISQHPTGKHLDEAYEYLFAESKSGGIKALDEYAFKYQDSPYKDAAVALADRIADSLYNSANKAHTIDAWNKYIESVPSSRARDAAMQIDKIKKEAEQAKWNTEARAWKTASSGNTISLYETYLKKYPNGAHAATAKKKIIDIRVNNIYAGEHGTLPTMDQTSYGYGSTSSITVTNDTGYTLTLLYSSTGHSREVILSKGQTKSFSLPNGTYRVAASVSAARVSNYVSTEKLTGGGYSSSYYIVTTRY